MQEIDVTFSTPLVVIHRLTGDLSGAIFTFQQGNFIFTGEHMASTMQVGSRATVSVQWKDSGGNIVKVDGPTTWESSVPATLQCTPASGNPQIANLYAPGPVGAAQIHATADADLGEGVKTVTATADITVISGEAESGEITFTPVDAKSAGKPPRRS